MSTYLVSTRKRNSPFGKISDKRKKKRSNDSKRPFKKHKAVSTPAISVVNEEQSSPRGQDEYADGFNHKIIA